MRISTPTLTLSEVGEDLTPNTGPNPSLSLALNKEAFMGTQVPPPHPQSPERFLVRRWRGRAEEDKTTFPILITSQCYAYTIKVVSTFSAVHIRCAHTLIITNQRTEFLHLPHHCPYTLDAILSFSLFERNC